MPPVNVCLKKNYEIIVLIYFMIRQKMLTPGIRPYKSENLYEQLEEREKIKKEVRYLEEKAKGRDEKPQKK